MKVHRRIVTNTGDPKSTLANFQGDWQNVEILSVEWCCGQAEQELTRIYEGTIGISRPLHGESTEDSIAFCPWCGKKIEYVEESPIRRTAIPKRKSVKGWKYVDEPTTVKITP